MVGLGQTESAVYRVPVSSDRAQNLHREKQGSKILFIYLFFQKKYVNPCIYQFNLILNWLCMPNSQLQEIFGESYFSTNQGFTYFFPIHLSQETDKILFIYLFQFMYLNCKILILLQMSENFDEGKKATKSGNEPDSNLTPI